MSNLIIRNTQASTLDLTPMRDVFDVIVVLRPKGAKGDSREISAETAEHETVARVKKAGWISLEPTGAVPVVAAPVPVTAPTPATVAEPEPAPVLETAPEPEPVPAPTETPSSKSRQSRK